jgi:cell division septation protein DedD
MKFNFFKIMWHLPLKISPSHWKYLLILFGGSSWFVGFTSTAMAQNNTTFGAVPLPPPSPPQSTPSTTVTPQIDFSQNNNTPIPLEFEYQSPQPTYNPPTATNSIYRVEVEGDSPNVLQLVRTVEPAAFIRRGERVIQVGLFQDALNAQNMIQQLSARGITARIVQISGSSNLGSNNLSTSSLNVYGEIQDDGYFVIIPGEMDNLFAIADKIKRSGIPNNALRMRSAPLGPHVAVGPFAKRDEAERWNSYLRSVGLDARVYFGH